MANDTPLNQFSPEDDIDAEWLALQRKMPQELSASPALPVDQDGQVPSKTAMEFFIYLLIRLPAL